MDNRIIVDAITTGHRNDSKEYYKELIFLYDDGTYEKIFRGFLCYDLRYLSGVYYKGLTRAQAIAKLEVYYYNDKLKGRFLDY